MFSHDAIRSRLTRDVELLKKFKETIPDSDAFGILERCIADQTARLARLETHGRRNPKLVFGGFVWMLVFGYLTVMIIGWGGWWPFLGVLPGLVTFAAVDTIISGFRLTERNEKGRAVDEEEERRRRRLLNQRKRSSKSRMPESA